MVDKSTFNSAIRFQRTFKTLSLVATCMFALTTLGCGESWLEVVPASGTVKVDGKAPEGAHIVLHPKTPVGTDPIAPTATVKPDGSYVITTYQAGDGAPPGEYVATVQWYQIDKDGIVGPNVIPKEYSTPQTSPIKVTVKSDGPTTIEPIAISLAKKSASARRGPTFR